MKHFKEDRGDYPRIRAGLYLPIVQLRAEIYHLNDVHSGSIDSLSGYYGLASGMH